MNVILIGFKNAGKTTLGKNLAIKLDRNFIDIDDQIVAIYKKKYNELITARQIYLKLGDSGYRLLEKEAIVRVGSTQNAIIASGGGSICDAENICILEQNGVFVYLDVPLKVIEQRIKSDTSIKGLDPKHPFNDFIQTFKERERIYKKIAYLTIKPESQTIDEIIEIIKKSIYGN